MKAPVSITTDRLVLRRPIIADASAIFERYAGDPEVTRFVGWPRHISVSDSVAFLEFNEREWQTWPAGPYLISSRADGRVLGSTGLAFEAADRATTGYVLARDAWGQGFATEALAAMVALARELGLGRLSAICHADHRASWRVMEKCGFTRVGTWREHMEFPNLSLGIRSDVLCYAITPCHVN